MLSIAEGDYFMYGMFLWVDPNPIFKEPAVIKLIIYMHMEFGFEVWLEISTFRTPLSYLKVYVVLGKTDKLTET
jgi:hypothetical protein